VALVLVLVLTEAQNHAIGSCRRVDAVLVTSVAISTTPLHLKSYAPLVPMKSALRPAS
jgi:hypothetical protein